MKPDPYSLHTSRLAAHSSNGTMYAILGVIVLLGWVLASTPFMAWIVMLLFGALHHSVWSAIPAFGFGPSVLIVFSVAVLKILVGRFSVSTK